MDKITIAVIGAGVMGTGIALNLSCYNHHVILVDINSQALQDARERMKADFRMVALMKPELKLLKWDDVISRIDFAEDYASLGPANIVIENIPENWEEKKALYKELNNTCRPEVIYAVNTSCISITKIAACVNRPENVIGAHFMNPVPLIDIVEVVKGYHTSDATIDCLTGFLHSFKKQVILVNDLPGFVANRLSHLFMNEAAFIVQDQVATPAAVDLIFKKGYGHAMGPLETADLIGLDTVVNSLNILYESYQDTKFRCCPLLKKMVEAGLLGRKTGQGFFKYNSINSKAV